MSNKKLDNLQFNRHVFSVTSLTDEDMEDKTYWFHKSPKERLIALEYLRQVMYSYDPNTTRLQRIFEIAQLPSR
jgi:hypothetical protein